MLPSIFDDLLYGPHKLWAPSCLYWTGPICSLDDLSLWLLSTRYIHVTAYDPTEAFTEMLRASLNFPRCYWMSPLTSVFIQLKRQDFLFWESATEYQTSYGFMKDHLQGTVKLSPIFSPLTQGLKIMLPSPRHYSRKGLESMMLSKVFLQKVP